NSGGPLLNSRGQVIGVSNADVGIGFAIPINTVKNVAAQLIAKGVVEHAFAGLDVHALSPRVATLFRLPVQRGTLVAKVCNDGGALLAADRSTTAPPRRGTRRGPDRLPGAPSFSHVFTRRLTPCRCSYRWDRGAGGVPARAWRRCRDGRARGRRGDLGRRRRR